MPGHLAAVLLGSQATELTLGWRTDPIEQRAQIREREGEGEFRLLDHPRLIADRQPEQPIPFIVHRTTPMKDQYLADRRDPVVKKLEREGLQALLATLGRSVA